MGGFRNFENEVGCAADHSFEFYQGEPEESQQGEHYSNRAWREQKRKREFWWLKNKLKKLTVELVDTLTL